MAHNTLMSVLHQGSISSFIMCVCVVRLKEEKKTPNKHTHKPVAVVFFFFCNKKRNIVRMSEMNEFDMFVGCGIAV